MDHWRSENSKYSNSKELIISKLHQKSVGLLGQGKKPIFITQNASLFTDIYRDTKDVGSSDLVPLIINSEKASKEKEADKGVMRDTDENDQEFYVYKCPSNINEILKSGTIPDEYDYVVLSYTQINSGDQQSNPANRDKMSQKEIERQISRQKKAAWLRSVAKDNYIFMDESHTAAQKASSSDPNVGDGEKGRNATKGGNTGTFLMSILPEVKGVVFASATFAKTPDTMPLYTLNTVMGKANVVTNELIDIIKRGGVRLQEIMSRALADAGQMFRRERDMTDVVMDWDIIDDPEIGKAAREKYEKAIGAFNAIIRFQKMYVDPVLHGMNIAAGEVMTDLRKTHGTEELGIKNQPFASRTYTYVKQLLLSLKVDSIVQRTLAELKKGESGNKVVIALENTIEKDLEEIGLGNTINEEDATCCGNLIRGLKNTLSYTITHDDGQKEINYLSLESLGKGAIDEYNRIVELIKESTEDIYINPLDEIEEKIRAAGYTIGEITGRKLCAKRNGDGTVTIEKRETEGKTALVNGFNNGRIDVLIVNKSGSTGISLHASTKFKDQRQRTMIVAQPLSDINDYMQMIGRIDRTGQVWRGYYINLGLPIPAETRYLMMLSTKLKSLNANTTSSQKGQNDVETPDMMNMYGSKIVLDFFIDNPEFYNDLCNHVGKLDLFQGDKEENVKPLEDLKATDDSYIKTATSAMALMLPSKQDFFYEEVTKRYIEHINYLNSIDDNELVVTTMPLRAKTLNKTIISKGAEPGGVNPFADNAYVEEVEMDVLKKPYTANEVVKVENSLRYGGNDGKNRLLEQIEKDTASKREEIEKSFAERKQSVETELEEMRKAIMAKEDKDDAEKRKEIDKRTKERWERYNGQKNRAIKKMLDQQSDLKEVIKRLNVGEAYEMPIDLTIDLFNYSSSSIFLGFKGRESMLTQASTKAVFAVMDGRRKVEVQLSDFNAIERIIRCSETNADVLMGVNLDSWDKLRPTKNRTNGYILTGNIVQAFNDSRGEDGSLIGKLIRFTDEEGNERDGILMPETWTIDQMKNEGIPFKDCEERLLKTGVLKSVGGDILIERLNDDVYRLAVPISKSNGGRYFNDPRILLLTEDRKFTQFGNKMIADIKGEKNVIPLINVLSRLGVKAEKEPDSEKQLTSEYLTNLTPADIEIQEGLQSVLEEAGVDVVFEDAEVADSSNGVDKQFQKIIHQAHTSAGTSLNQVPSAMRKIDWRKGTKNLDLGGGKYDTATKYLAEQGVESFVFDPFNRSAEHNRPIADLASKKGFDTVTCCNVLNVIDNESAIENIVLQTSKAIKSDGKVYFSVYEADKSGESGEAGKKTDQWQNRKPLAEYVKYVAKYYDNIQMKNGIIVASEPKQTEEKSAWILDSTQADRVEFSKPDGTVYGWYENGQIHLVNGRLNPNTTLHESTHMLSAIMREVNPEGWKDVVRVCKEAKELWDEVKNDPNYSNLKTDDDIASEVISRHSGKNGRKKLNDWYNKLVNENKGLKSHARIRVLFNKVREALARFWGWVGKNLFNTKQFKNIDEVADMMLSQVLSGEKLPTPPRGGNRERMVTQPIQESGEPLNEYLKRVEDFYNSFKVEEAVDSYTREINKQADAKHTIYKIWMDAASPIENFEKWVIDNGGNKTPSAYEDTFLATGRITTGMNDFERNHIRPLSRTIDGIVSTGKLDNVDIRWHNLDENDAKDNEKRNGTKLTPRELLGVYAQAKDCQEAEKLGLPDRGAEGFEKNLGMTYQDVIDAIEPALSSEEVNDFWDKVNDATSFALNYELERGYIDKTTYDKYQRRYYVPERGWRERDMSSTETQYRDNGRIYNQPYNKALRKAQGRSSLASDPFAYIMSIGGSSISSAEKNVTKQKLLDFCLENEELGLKTNAFKVRKFWAVQDIDPSTGRVRLDDTGTPIVKISYAQPTAEMYENDEKTRNAITIRQRQLGKLKRDYNLWSKIVEDPNTSPSFLPAAERGLNNVEQQINNTIADIEDLMAQLNVVSSVNLETLKQRTPDESMQHVVYVVKDGQKYALWMRDEKLAQAVNRDYEKMAGEMSKLGKAMRSGTRLFSAMLTQYNPEFALSNFFRDYQVALATLGVEHGAKIAASFMNEFNKCMPAVWTYAFNDKVKEKDKFVSGKYGDYLKEYFEHGAQTGFSYLQDLDLLKKSFDELVNDTKGKQVGRATIGLLSMLTEVSETGVRFAGYVAARENGKTSDEAAIISKELTTNFDRGGELSRKAYMSLFSFMRATINGNLKFIKGFKNFAKGYSVVAGVYFALGLMNALINPDDPDDGVWFSNYTRESNFALGKLLGITAKIPVAHFMRMFFAAGNNLGAALNGRKSTEEAVYDTMNFASAELLPSWMNFGNAVGFNSGTGGAEIRPEEYVQSAVPSVFSPIADIYLNRDFMGRAINGNKYVIPGDEYKKDIHKYRNDTPDFYNDIANGIYSALGGDLSTKTNMDDNVLQSIVDISPSSYEHFIEGYSPAAVNTIALSAMAIKAAAQGENVSATEIPFIRRFYSEYNASRAMRSEYYTLSHRVDVYKNTLKDHQNNNKAKYNQDLKSDMYTWYVKAEKAVRMSKNKKPTNKEVKQLMELNKQWNKLH